MEPKTCVSRGSASTRPKTREAARWLMALSLASVGCSPPASEPTDAGSAAGDAAIATDGASLADAGPTTDGGTTTLDAASGDDAWVVDAATPDDAAVPDAWLADAATCVPVDPGPPTDPTPVTTSGSLTACPVDTTLVDGWCSPRLEVGPLVTITVPTYEPCSLPPAVRADRSVLVTDHQRFAGVEADLSLGRLLTDRNAFMNAYVVNNGLNQGMITGGNVHSRRAGTFQPFEGGRSQVDDHNAFTGPHLGTVRQIHNSWDEWILGPNAFGGTGLWDDTGSAAELSDPDGPFRLLAVVDRMDLAGEVDGRQLGLPGSTLAEDLRKWFGEGRLVFGLTDGGDGARDMTFIVEYRLPALREIARDATSTTYAVQPACSRSVTDGCFDHEAGPRTNAEWLEGRARWARVWRELSDPALSVDEYNARLRDIVRLFARPENFIALRAGERVRDASGTQGGIEEFEYREFYSNGGFGLARRHNRREALFCAGGSQFLRDLIVDEYDAALTTPVFDFRLGPQSFNVGRDDAWLAAMRAACGTTAPFDASDGMGGLSIRPAFARFGPEQVWPELPRYNAIRGTDDDEATTEAYRHVMAFNTCSGCHSAETGTHGFQIAPRTASADATLSPFLDGTDHTVHVDVGGHVYSYTYNELARRVGVLTSFYEHEDLGSETPRHTFEAGLEQALVTCTTSPCGR